MRVFRKELITNQLKEMIESKDQEVNANKIFEIIEDKLKCLEGNEDKEYETN